MEAALRCPSWEQTGETTCAGGAERQHGAARRAGWAAPMAPSCSGRVRRSLGTAFCPSGVMRIAALPHPLAAGRQHPQDLPTRQPGV